MKQINIEFCNYCGGWVGAACGQMRAGENGEPVVVCDGCLERHTESGLTNRVSKDSRASENRSHAKLGPQFSVIVAK